MATRRPQTSLPPKFDKLFKEVVKLYERKQYRRSIKLANQILTKYPEHGETMAMKGLVMNNLGQKEEGFELAKNGLKFALNSYVCWHVLGLMYRSDHDYAEAIKCYRMALRHDQKNLTILRDLSLLYIQLRDIKGFLEIRQKMLKVSPKPVPHWLGFAVAQHLKGDLSYALRILDAYEKNTPAPAEPEFEFGELMLYKNSLYEELGDYAVALSNLQASAQYIVDKTVFKEKRAFYLHMLGEKDEAVEQLRVLVKQNPEHYTYHYQLLAAMGLAKWEPRAAGWGEMGDTTANVPVIDAKDDAAVEKFDKLYQDFAVEFPKCLAVQQIPLQVLSDTHPRFLPLLNQYVKSQLTKGIPSLFTSLKPLYSEQAKAKTLGELVYGIIESLQKSGTFPADEEKAPAHAIIWALNFAAQHEDRLGNTDKALEHINAAILHTPTAHELYLSKAKIFKHAGSLQRAADIVDDARQMDLADRYLNTKCTRYLLRADRIQQAEDTIHLFTKDSEGTANNLFEMQCMWFELEMAMAHQRLQNYGPALKKALSVKKHIEEMCEDQFDFHTYCLRKMTLRSYIALLRLEDRIFSHPYLFRAVFIAIEVYLTLADQAPRDEREKEVDESKLNKKQLNRLKRERKEREEAKEAEQKERAENTTRIAKGLAFKLEKGKDTDPSGDRLVMVTDLVEEAARYVALMEKNIRLNVHSKYLKRFYDISFEVYLRKKQYLAALRSVKRLYALEGETSAPGHCNALRLLAAVPKDYDPFLHKILNEEFPHIEKKDFVEECRRFLAANHTSPIHRRSAAVALNDLLRDSRPDKELIDLLSDMKGTSQQDALDSVATAARLFSTNSDCFRAVKAKCHEAYPLVDAFDNTDYIRPKEDKLEFDDDVKEVADRMGNLSITK